MDSHEADSATSSLLQIATDVLQGAVDAKAGAALAAQLGAAGAFPVHELIGLAHSALDATAGNGWRRTLPVVEVAAAAASAGRAARPDDPPSIAASMAVAADLIEIIHAGLFEAGDIRLFRRAREAFDHAVDQPDSDDLAALRGLVLLRFGSLVVDAYTAGRSPANYDGQFATWVGRARQSGDPDLLWTVSTPVHGIDEAGEVTAGEVPSSWPAPLEALADAEQHLREAVGLVVAERRGRALKALAQAVQWQGLLGGPDNREEVVRIATAALEELPADDTQSRLGVVAMLEQAGGAHDAEALVRRMEDDWDAYRATTTESTAWDAVGQGVVLVQSDPQRALSLLAKRRELTTVWADDVLRGRHLETELGLFVSAFAPPAAAPGDDLDAAALTAMALAEQADSPAQARIAAAAIMRVMRATPSAGREALGLSLVAPASRLDATLWRQHGEAVGHLVASLTRDEGVNRMHAGDVDGAGRRYRDAAGQFCRGGFAVQMVQCLEYLDDALRAGMTELDELTAWLAASSLDLELAGAATGPQVVQDLAGHLLAAHVARGTSPEVVELLFEVVKGRRFGATLAGGWRSVDFQATAGALLQRVAEAEAELPDGSDLLRPTG